MLDQGRDSREDEADESDVPSGGKLKAVLGYVALAALPLALIALGAAAVAFMDSRATQARLKEVTAELQNVNASLSATRNELESLKFIVSRQKAQLDAERKQEGSPQQAAPAAPHATPPAASGTLQKQEKKPETKPESKPAPAPVKPAAKPAEKKVPDQTLTTAPEKSGAKQLQGIREAIDKFNQK